MKIPSYCLLCSSSSLTAADKHLTLSGPVLYTRHTAWGCGKTACSPLFEKGHPTRTLLLHSQLVTLTFNFKQTLCVLHPQSWKTFQGRISAGLNQCSSPEVKELTVKRDQIKAWKPWECCCPCFMDGTAESGKGDSHGITVLGAARNLLHHKPASQAQNFSGVKQQWPSSKHCTRKSKRLVHFPSGNYQKDHREIGFIKR